MMTSGVIDDRFWTLADELVSTSEIVLDRTRGSDHPRYPETRLPLDYGYLAQTEAMDGSGIDVWIGSLPERRVTSVMVTLDLLKRDAEIKLLIGCTSSEAQEVLAHHNAGAQAGLLLWR
jgi:inorganic pyrophosphatase